MDTTALLNFAEQNSESLTEIGREVLYRLETIYWESERPLPQLVDEALKTA
jgi:hypothetical protein